MKKNLLKRIGAISICMSLVLNLGNTAISKAESGEEADSYIVLATDKSTMNALERKYEDSGSVSELSVESMKAANFTTLELSDSEAAAIEKDDDVLIVEPDVEVQAFSTDNDSETVTVSCDEWNYQAIHADDAGQEEAAGEDKVKVALIDSGVDMYNDIEVKEYINLIPGEEEVLPLFWDVSGHGTSIAGIIAAEDNGEGITGIDPNIELYSARVLDENRSAPVSRIIEAIYWAIEKDVDIISLSFGTPARSEALERAVKDAHNRGILIIAAAGNQGDVEYPAAMEEVMAVGGTDTDGTVCDYSGQGEEVEIVAPAEKIITTGGFDGVMVTNGTSMAVPHVVGVAARLWEKDRTKTADFIRQLMNAAANPCDQEVKCGNGLLDYQRALEIYDDFEKKYSPAKTPEQNQSAVEENDAPIQAFEDVNCVNGSWHLDPKKDPENHTHTSLANEALTANGYIVSSSSDANSAYIISMVKKGAIYPDLEDYNMNGMESHPCLHGYFKTTTGSASCNYVKNYIKCTEYAKEIRNGKTYSKPSSTDPNDVDKELQLLFSGVSWEHEGASAVNRAAFAYGIAMHTATDVYAHSVWTTQYGRLFHLKKNGNEYADDSSIVEERFKVAQDVAINILKHFKNNTVGTADDLCNSSNYNGSLFKLYNFQTYLNTYSTTLGKRMENNSKTY